MAITKPLILDETGQDMVDELTDIITAIDNISRFSGAYNDLTGKPTLGTAAAKNFTTSVTSGSSDLVTSGAVYTAIDNLPNPMLFKGTLGTNGTITSLPTAGSTNEGFTYKVITAATYSGTAAKVGDVFVSNGSAWILIPAGDDVEDTWRNIKVNGTEKLGTGISSGAVDFVNGTNTTAAFNASGNKVSFNASDEKVTQTNTSSDNDYRILLSGTADSTTRTEGARKSGLATFNTYKMATTFGTRESNSTVGSYSFVEGYSNKATEIASHAEGRSTEASGEYSHAEGYMTKATGNKSHAEGNGTTASGHWSHAEGDGSTASGDYTHAEGGDTTASEDYAHSEGLGSTASSNYAHSEGYYSEASGPAAHAEGDTTSASGNCAHAEGFHTIVSANNSHAEGSWTSVTGNNSHAEGTGCEASGYSSHAEGENTIANGRCSHVFGTNNVADTVDPISGIGNYVEIVGNGTDYSDDRRNARTLDWDGNEMLAGSLDLAGANSDINLSGNNNTWDGSNTSLKAAIADTSVTKEASGNPVEFSDGANAPLVKCVTAIQGNQDLHGYDKPWVGGVNKNLLPVTVENIKAKNISGLWSGNIYTYNNITMTILTDNGDNVVGVNINTNGATAETNLVIADIVYDADTSYYATSGATQSVNGLGMGSNGFGAWDIDQQRSIDRTGQSGFGSYIYYKVDNGAVINNVTVYPMIRLATETDPTFSPYSNICPITAYTEGEIEVRGKNLFDKNASDVAVGYYLVASTGILTPSQSGYNTSGYILIKPNTYYTKSGASVSTDEYCFYDSAKTFISGYSRADTTVLSPNNAAYMRFDYKASETDNIQIEEGSTATTYKPYEGVKYTTTYPNSIYRGSEDVMNGKVTTQKVKLSKKWSEGVSVTVLGDYTRKAFVLPSDAVPNDPDAICNVAPRILNYTSDELHFYVATTTALVFLPNDTDGNTDIEVVYTLATPATESITPTNLPIKSLFGYNHIESSTGEMEVEYIAKAFSPITEIVDSQISALQKMMELMLTANREEEMKATQNYTAGELLIVSGKLYKASSNIANGSTLVINSNVTSTTIAAELAALA